MPAIVITYMITMREPKRKGTKRGGGFLETVMDGGNRAEGTRRKRNGVRMEGVNVCSRVIGSARIK